MTELTVASLMDRDPATVRPHTPFKDVLELLTERGVGAVPVVSASGAVIGTVSETDLLRRRCHPPRQGISRLTAIELMTSPAITVPSDTTLAEATRLLADSGLPGLFIVDDGLLVGALSPHDLLSVFLRPDKEIHAAIEHEVFELLGAELAYAVRVDVNAGVVQLTGRLPRRGDIEPALARIAEIPGVVNVKERTR